MKKRVSALLLIAVIIVNISMGLDLSREAGEGELPLLGIWNHAVYEERTPAQEESVVFSLSRDSISFFIGEVKYKSSIGMRLKSRSTGLPMLGAMELILLFLVLAAYLAGKDRKGPVLGSVVCFIHDSDGKKWIE